ncbi:DUF4436 family protein [Actinophytocola oryzae]|uniref:Uncharacterized protein DUF4436 n=1 Tax=Actinophytocola oryzae TaxID=502181 RepID=A0A4V6Q6J1_9PSEU|nr:DUF4436 family protein [Actinophytocola oryzae]TDV40941.1 uncharacterized protein DUF4436 [Actinophytocola oryzae]
MNEETSEATPPVTASAPRTATGAVPAQRSAPPGSHDTKSTRKGTRIGLVLTLLIAFTAAYLVVLFTFLSGDSDRSQHFTSDGGTDPDRVTIDVTLLTINADDNAYQVRVDAQPQGRYRAADGALTAPLRMTLDEIDGDHTTELAAGQWMPLREATLTADGDTSLYPFDEHHIPLEIAMSDARGEPVPITLDLNTGLHDWEADAVMRPDSHTGDIRLEMTASRSAPVVTFALGLMVVLVLLVVVTVGMVTRAISTGKIGFPTLASLAALLFAIPGIRNSMPDTPPVGTLSDFVVFFWALSTVAICMTIASLAWLRHARRTADDPAD